MKTTRKILSMVLAIAMVLSCAATAFAASKTTATISGNTANIVTIPRNGSTGAVITIGNDSVNKDMNASDHITKAKAKGGTLLASVNGALFNAYYKGGTLSYPDNCAVTYGTLVSDGQVIRGGGDMPLLGVTSDGKYLIDKVKTDIRVKFRGKDPFSFWTVNGYYKDATAVSLFTKEMGYSVPLQPGTVVVRINNGIVSAVQTGLTSLAVPAAGEYVITFNSAVWANACQWNTQPAQGNSAIIETTFTPSKGNSADWKKVVTAVGCSPWLLQNGQDVFAQNTNTDPKMGKDYAAQRTFAAVNANGDLIIGEVSGTFTNIIKWLQANGYVDAMALDGGASSTVYYEGAGFIQPAGRKLSNMIHFIDFGSAGAVENATKPANPNAPSAWAQPYVDKANINGLIPADFAFVPKANITRVEFATLAMQLIKSKIDADELSKTIYRTGIGYWDAREALTDTYDMNVIQCYQLGIVAGKGNNKFEPNASITRAEAAVMLTNTAKVLGIDAKGSSLNYVDAADISWAMSFVDFVTRAGIMGSASSKEARFNPKGFYTQEQTIVTMVNMFEK